MDQQLHLELYLEGKSQAMWLLFHNALESVDVFREGVGTPGTQLNKDLQCGQGGATQAKAFHQLGQGRLQQLKGKHKIMNRKSLQCFSFVV